MIGEDLAKKLAGIKARLEGAKSPLGIAIFDPHYKEAMQMLFQEGNADTETRSPDGRTPLYEAAFHDKKEAMKLLIAAGANCCVHDLSFGRYPLCTGQSYLNNSTPLHVVAARGDLEGVKILLNGGADPTAKNEDGHTPSEVALDKRHGNIATVLSRPSKIA